MIYIFEPLPAVEKRSRATDDHMRALKFAKEILRSNNKFNSIINKAYKSVFLVNDHYKPSGV